VALQLDDRDLLGRDVFPRVPPDAEDVDVDPGLKSVSIFKLVELMARMLRKAPVRSHEIAYETYSISERIDHVFEFGRAHGQRFTIGELLATVASRAELVVTFIAVLEMTKLGMVKLFIHEERAAPEPPSHEAEAAAPSSPEAAPAPAPPEAEAAVDGPAGEATLDDEESANDEESLPTIWIHLTGKTRDSDLVDDYRG
jgi:segregation and condensation protein A